MRPANELRGTALSSRRRVCQRRRHECARFVGLAERPLRRPDRLAHHFARQPQVPRDRLDRLACRVLTANPNHCLHHQHPDLDRPAETKRSVLNHRNEGSLLGADHPAKGVLFPRRSTRQPRLARHLFGVCGTFGHVDFSSSSGPPAGAYPGLQSLGGTSPRCALAGQSYRALTVRLVGDRTTCPLNAFQCGSRRPKR